jgi:hypothetical protein
VYLTASCQAQDRRHFLAFSGKKSFALSVSQRWAELKYNLSHWLSERNTLSTLDIPRTAISASQIGELDANSQRKEPMVRVVVEMLNILRKRIIYTAGNSEDRGSRDNEIRTRLS